MKRPFLTDNELILIDYVPGSSGQLLIRLWSELDGMIGYDNDKMLTESCIANHMSTREIDYDIKLPKRIVDWFLDRCEPETIEDYSSFFDFLGTALVALEERWRHGNSNQRFYSNVTYQMRAHRLLYGIHTWEKIIPWTDLINNGYNIRHIGIVPMTARGIAYQKARAYLCYPEATIRWDGSISAFNEKHFDLSIDLCTLLVDHDYASIMDWLRQQIGRSFRDEKRQRAFEIMDTYCRGIVDAVGVGDV